MRQYRLVFKSLLNSVFVDEMTRLSPSFTRVTLRVGIVIIFVCVLGYFLQGFREGKWWTAGYIYSLAIPVIIMPILVWFMFVPRLIEFSETEITIETLLGKSTYPWSALYCYGTGRGVYKLQFSGDSQPYQIFAGAYSAEEWSKLVDFMTKNFPDQAQASFQFGVQMRPKGKK